MFGKFAYQFSGDQWGEDWTPPWLHHTGRRGGPGRRGPWGPWQAHMHRRGGPGFWGPQGPFGNPEQRGPGGRLFGRGDMKFALLELLQERPMYGYEMIKALEEKSGGFYSPSPGSIYPTLQMLEERGLISSQEIEGKKVYSITDIGRALLDEHQQQQPPSPWEHLRRAREEMGRGPRQELHALRHEAMDLTRLFVIAGRNSLNNPEQLSQLRKIIERTRKELNDLIYGQPSSSEASEDASADQ